MIRTVLAWIDAKTNKADVATTKGFGTCIGTGILEGAMDALVVVGVVNLVDKAVGKFTNR